jgi:DNA recombination protein RmuC
MTADALTTALVALAVLNLGVLAALWLRGQRGDGGAHDRRHAETLAQMERLERELRDELGRQAQASRADLAGFQQTLLAQGAESARTQNEQLGQLALRNEQRLGEVRTAVQEQLKALQEGNERKLDQGVSLYNAHRPEKQIYLQAEVSF